MNIIIADDHELIAEGVSSFLSKINKHYVIRTATNIHDLKKEMETQQFDVLIQDVRFGSTDARDITEDIHELNPDCKLIALSSQSDEFTVKSVLAKGYSAYVTKNAHMTEIAEAIKKVMLGEQFISSDLEEKFFRSLFKNEGSSEEIQLTERESEVLSAILNGMSSKEIGDKLFISEKTVETYRSNLFLKFQVKNVASLVKKSLLLGFG
jgi:DNA-binding NarL/FixJ family response regulator